MSETNNSKLVEQILITLVEKIARRTSESYAVVALHSVIKNLIPKYDFLKYIDVQETYYSEGIQAVNVYHDLDYTDSKTLYEAIDEVIKITVQYLENNADYFFIKEFQESINKINPEIFNDSKIDLNYLQSKYIVNRIEQQKIKNKEIARLYLAALASTVNKLLPEQKVMALFNKTITNLKVDNTKYEFLKYITIYEQPDPEGFYRIEIMDNLNDEWPNAVGKALQDLTQQIINDIEWKGKESFVDTLKKDLGIENVEKSKKIGINLEQLIVSEKKKEHQALIEKVFNALIKVIAEKTSENFAVITLDHLVNDLKITHEPLNYVKVDFSKISQGLTPIEVTDDVNSIDSYIIGKAIRDLVKTSGHNLGKDTYDYIERFKEEIGEEDLEEIERIGVNLHFLELKFA